MQLNFLQEDLAAALQKSKKTSAPKNIPKLSSSSDLFGGLPLAMPPAKAEPVTESKTETKPAPKLSSDAVVESPKKSENAFKTISEVAAILEVPQHVLRFWESRFSQIKPLKMSGGRRYYRPEDIDILSKIQNLLYKQGYTIKGAKKAFSMKDTVSKENSAPKIEAAPKTSKEVVISAKEATKESGNQIILSDKQKKQIAGLLKELTGLRETLRPYLREAVAA